MNTLDQQFGYSHVTNEIKKFIKKDLKSEDFVISEIGGTVGDIESYSLKL